MHSQFASFLVAACKRNGLLVQQDMSTIRRVAELASLKLSLPESRVGFERTVPLL